MYKDWYSGKPSKVQFLPRGWIHFILYPLLKQWDYFRRELITIGDLATGGKVGAQLLDHLSEHGHDVAAGCPCS